VIDEKKRLAVGMLPRLNANSKTPETLSDGR
jgi:hypothetical protein